jgi:hypothetical protein
MKMSKTSSNLKFIPAKYFFKVVKVLKDIYMSMYIFIITKPFFSKYNISKL